MILDDLGKLPMTLFIQLMDSQYIYFSLKCIDIINTPVQ